MALRTGSPDWPFQQIVLDLFHAGGQTYLACADRLTGWLIIHHLNQGQANASSLISICRDIFQTYGAPEELSSDGGPPFKSSTFTQFLKDWAVKHRLSSAAYSQSNGRAELAVKTAKRIIIGNTGPQPFCNIEIRPSKTSVCPRPNCCSTADCVTLCHPTQHYTSHMQNG